MSLRLGIPCRLQVEHPVTEMITNVNLPAAQLQIAMGIPLYCIPDIRRLYGEDEQGTTPIDFEARPPVEPKGHVIACRITAENPDAGFQPTSGAIRELNFRSTANVWGYFSVDGSGRVHEYADSQFGHLFAWGRNRETARKSMVQALREFSIRGEIRTTIEYLLQLIQNEEYVQNAINTSWLDGLIQHNLHAAKPDSCFVVLIASACKGFLHFKENKREYMDSVHRGQFPLPTLLSVRHHEDLVYENVKYAIDIYWSGESLLTLVINASSAQMHIRELADGGFLINSQGQSHVAYLMDNASGLRLSMDGVTCVFSQEHDPSVLRCPNSGKLVRYLVQAGDHVVPGQTFAEMEVMKMYLPLVVKEAGVIAQLVKAVGSVVQNGDVLGYMRIDDLSKVQRAQQFTSPLPDYESASKSVTLPHHTMTLCLTLLQSFLNGYWIPEDQVNACLDTILSVVRDPSLPFYEYLDVLSTMEANLPDALKQELNDALFVQEPSADSPRSVKQEEKSPFRQGFPAKKIRQILSKHLMLAKKRVDLAQIVSPLYEVLSKYKNGLAGYAISVLFQLLEWYTTNQHAYESIHSTISEMRRSNSDAYCEQLWRSDFSHQHQESQALFVIHLLHLLSSLIPVAHEEGAHFEQVLQDVSLLSDSKSISVSLEARQLLLQRKLPSREEEREAVRSALTELAQAAEKDREALFARLLERSSELQQTLLEILLDSSGDLDAVAVECYLRKIYQPYVLLSVQRCPLGCFLALSFQFASEASELPTGIRPSSSFSSESNSPLLSPHSQSNDEESAPAIGGLIVLVRSLPEMAQALPLITQHLLSARESKNVVHILLNETPSVSCTELIQQYKTLLSSVKEDMSDACITRITITQPSPPSRLSPSWDLPSSITFKQRLHYEEDSLVRFIEPPLAYHLELARLRNYRIQLVPIPNRSIHLYEAFPKEPIVIRGSTLPLRRRFFVRAVCSTMDALDTQTITNTYPSAEKALVEALNALEIGISEVRVKGLENTIAGSHIFLNVLSPSMMDPNLIERIMKKLYHRYAKRIASLHVTQVEMRLLPILSQGSQPIPIRMVGTDPTGMALKIDTYVETKDNYSGAVIFTSINERINDSAGEWDGHSVNMAYPVLEYLERERAYAQKTSGTLYCYDFLELIQRVLLERWKSFLKTNESLRVVMPSRVMSATELELVQSGDAYDLREVSRPPGKNKIGMVAWQITLFTPTYPKEGREIILIANDITFKAGSFGLREDMLFDLASKRARRLGVPRIFIAANSGARIGLAEEVKRLFRVKWCIDEDPQSGVAFLYLTREDYERVKEEVKAHPVTLQNETVYQIDAIIGKEPDLGVENLAGSAMIAGETSRAYRDVVTMTIVSGRSVGIGAYLVRLGQRTIQKAADAPILLTGYEALNHLMGKKVYSSNDQLGGTGIMCPNGVTHVKVDNDYEAVSAMMRWLSFIPRTNRAELVPQPLSSTVDVIDRDVTVTLSRDPYDIRSLLCGVERDGEWESGLFDRGSFMEVLVDWAKTVVAGRARLGGIPVGVIATESRTVESVVPADPAMPQSEEMVTQQAGGVWYPDSAYKTAQAIQDINQEGLPLFIVANWRGFSGGARDMFREVLKYGSFIVDQLVQFRQPVFVYIPAYAELRGGAFVVVDPHINDDVMEMYADSRARAGVLEPTGVVSIKYRKEDKRRTMERNDGVLRCLTAKLGRVVGERLGQVAGEDMLEQMTGERQKIQEKIEDRQKTQEEIENRQKELETPYQQVAEVFADLHDGAERMKAMGVIRAIVDVEQSRHFFYWRLRRRLLQMKIEREIVAVSGRSMREAQTLVEEWYKQSNQYRFSHCSSWDDNEMVFNWMSREYSDSITAKLNSLKKAVIKEEVIRMGRENPYTVAEGVIDLLGSLSGEVKERVVTSLKRGVLFQSNSPATFYEDDNQFSEFCSLSCNKHAKSS